MTTLPYDINPLALKLSVALVIYALAEVAMAAHSGVLVWYFGQLGAEDADIMYLTSLSDGIDNWGIGIGSVYLLIFIVCVILSCLWVFRAAKNAWALAPNTKKMSAGWSVGWYFVPLANYFMPYKGMREIWNATFAPREPIDSAVPGFFKLWWGCWMALNVLSNISMRLSIRDDIESLTIAEYINIATMPFGVVTAILFAMIVRQISRQQSISALSLSHNEETSNDKV